MLVVQFGALYKYCKAKFCHHICIVMHGISYMAFIQILTDAMISKKKSQGLPNSMIIITRGVERFEFNLLLYRKTSGYEYMHSIVISDFDAT